MLESPLVRDRWVRIFCDYSADPVWAKDGGGCDLEDLPVSASLAARLRAWARRYERKDSGLLVIDWDEGPAFTAEGLAIAKAVKAELPDWTVIYLDEAALEAGWPRENARKRRLLRAAKARGVSRRGQMRILDRVRRKASRRRFEFEII
jgi:hypothetical protein